MKRTVTKSLKSQKKIDEKKAKHLNRYNKSSLKINLQFKFTSLLLPKMLNANL